MTAQNGLGCTQVLCALHKAFSILLFLKRSGTEPLKQLEQLFYKGNWPSCLYERDKRPVFQCHLPLCTNWKQGEVLLEAVSQPSIGTPLVSRN